MLSPKSKRRREEHKEVVGSSQSRRTEVQQPPCNSNTNSGNVYHKTTEDNAVPSRTANIAITLTKKRPHRKTVVILDGPQRQNHTPSSSSSSQVPQVEMNLMNDTSFRSLNSVQSSATFASAQEFMIDCETDHSAEEIIFIYDNNDPLSQSIVETNPTITTNINDASNSTGITARKSSEASSSTGTGTSSIRSGHPSTNTVKRRNDRNDTDVMNNNNRTTTNTNDNSERRDVTWQDHSDNNEENNDNTSNDGDTINLTGWELFVHTISTVPDEEYYTKSCTTWYDVLQKLRITLGYFVTNHIVQMIIVALIIINALLMGVATFDFVTEDPEVLHIFAIVDLIFLIIFTVELGFQLFYCGISLLCDAWLVFDLIIIVLSWSLQSIQIIRAFRIFRALRLVARLKVLRELITALGAVMPRMYAISMLLFLIFYIFAVLFTQLFGELELSGNYFTTLDASLFTCMNMMTLEWINVTREVMTHHSWAWAPISSFISITGFIVYNLVVAVVCDAVAVLDRTKQQEAHAAQKKIDEREHAVTQRDQMNITQQRFEELFNNIERMKQQHVNMCHTVDMLTSELQQSMIVIANLQQQLSQNQKV